MPLKRLTRRDPGRPEIVHTECENCVSRGEDCTGWNCATMLAKRLAEFEDPGFTPEQLNEQRQRYMYLGVHFGGHAFQCPVCRSVAIGWPSGDCGVCGAEMLVDEGSTRR